MAPNTRSQGLKTPSPQRSRGTQADIIQKARFFSAWDARESTDSIRSIYKATKTTKGTASRWLHQREQLGSPTLRRTRKLSDHLGRKSKISDKVL